MAASNLQAIKDTSYLSTNKWLMQTGSLKPFQSKKINETKKFAEDKRKSDKDIISPYAISENSGFIA